MECHMVCFFNSANHQKTVNSKVRQSEFSVVRDLAVPTKLLKTNTTAVPTRWAPSSYKWSHYNPYKWPGMNG